MRYGIAIPKPPRLPRVACVQHDTDGSNEMFGALCWQIGGEDAVMSGI